MPELKNPFLFCIINVGLIITLWGQIPYLSPITFSYFLLSSAFLLSAIHVYQSRRLTFSLLAILVCCWLVWCYIPLQLKWIMSHSFYGYLASSLWVGVFFVILFCQPKLEKLWLISVYSIGIFSLISAIYSLVQFYLLNDMPTGLFSSRNTNGAFLMMGILLLNGELYMRSLLSKDGQIEKTLSYIIILILNILFLALLSTLSRGVLLAFFSCALLQFLILRHSLKKNMLTIVALSLLFTAILFFISAQSAIHHRVDLYHHENSRLLIWQGAWHLWQQVRWYGIGLGNFIYFYPAFSPPGDGSSLFFAHNDYLQLLIETGYPGIVFLAAIILFCMYGFIRCVFKSQPTSKSRIYVTTLFLTLAAMGLHSLVDFNFFIPTLNFLFGCLLGLLYLSLEGRGSLMCPAKHQSIIKSFILLSLGIFFILITHSMFRMLMMEQQRHKTNDLVVQQDYKKAFLQSQKGIAYFDDIELQSQQVDIVLQILKQPKNSGDNNGILKEAFSTIRGLQLTAPYFAKTDFQLGLMHALYLHDPNQARQYFSAAVTKNPQFSLARITFALFLLDEDNLTQARELLEKGLSYPIYPDSIKTYLGYLAKMRLLDNDKKGSDQVLERMNNLDADKNDYSDLLGE